jgi:multiple sugar transport system substrate-binding protein
MKMKRSLVVVGILCIAGSLAFAAGRQTAGEKTKLTMWSQNRGQSPYWDPLIPVYNATNTDNIELEPVRWFGDDFYQAVELTVQTGGDLPDLFASATLACFSGLMHQQGWFVNLDDWLKTHTTPADQEFLKIYGPYKAEGQTVRDGGWYTAGYTATGGNRLIYNKDIFVRAGLPARAPETLEEMVEFARQITTRLKGEGIYGFGMNMKNPDSAYGRSLSPQTFLYSGRGMDGYDPLTGQYKADTNEAWNLIQAWQLLLSPDIVFPGSESLDIDPLRAQFADGKIGMYISYGFEAMLYTENGQFPTSYDFGMAKIPVPGGNYKGKTGVSVEGLLLLNAKGKHVEEAWKVYRDLFHSTDNMAGLITAGFVASSVAPEIMAKATPLEIYRRVPYANFQADADCLNGISYSSGGLALEGESINAVYDRIIQGRLGRTEAMALLKDAGDRYQRGMQLAIDRGELTRWYMTVYDSIDLSKNVRGAQIPKSR